jgi:hypothetical protein
MFSLFTIFELSILKDCYNWVINKDL